MYGGQHTTSVDEHTTIQYIYYHWHKKCVSN